MTRVGPPIPSTAWEYLFSWMPPTSECAVASGCRVPLIGLLFYGLLGIGIGILVVPSIKPEHTQFLPWNADGDGDGDSDTEPDANAEQKPDEREDDPLIDALEDVQQAGLHPPGIEREYTQARIGDAHRKQLFVADSGDELEPGLLRQFFVRPDLTYDMAIHLSPLDSDRAQSEAESRASAYEADMSILKGSNQRGSQFAASDKLDEAERTKLFRDEIQDGQRPFEYSIYISARGETESDVSAQVEKIRDVLERNPTQWSLSVLEGEQIPGFQSTAPLGQDILAERPEWDPRQVTLGSGVGSLLSSMSESRILEPSGVEIGEHAFNGSPMIKDPFQSETNYNQVVIGDSGSGKSFNTKVQALRTWESRDDVKLFFLDPMRNFQGLATALDAQHITVGGDRGLNPLDIRQPPEAIRESLPSDFDPLSQKIQEVLEFFDNFFEIQNLDIHNARPILTTAIANAYASAGITADSATHDRPSPTISDVIDILDEMATDGTAYTLRSDDEATEIEKYARQLKNHLRLFEDGQYENLSEPSGFDLRDEDVVYIDLSQQESQAGGGSGLMMQLMFSLVYEQAKQTTKNVVFIIDEARFLMKEASSLEFLGQRVRHSRHYDTSIRFITQEIGDFFASEEGESIINNSFMLTLHRTSEIDQWQEEFGLNDAQLQYIREAKAGSGETEYSEALVQIHDEWYPIVVSAQPREKTVVSFDPRADDPEQLPGLAQVEDNPVIREIQGRLRSGARQPIGPDSQPPFDGESLQNSWQTLSPRQQEQLDLLNGPELLQLLHTIEELCSSTGEKDALSQQIDTAVTEAVEQKVAGIVDSEELDDENQP